MALQSSATWALHVDSQSAGCCPPLCCRKFVDDFHKLGLPGLHVLVNNAGVHLKVWGRAWAVPGCYFAAVHSQSEGWLECPVQLAHKLAGLNLDGGLEHHLITLPVKYKKGGPMPVSSAQLCKYFFRTSGLEFIKPLSGAHHDCIAGAQDR
jgi:hypothetical protein